MHIAEVQQKNQRDLIQKSNVENGGLKIDTEIPIFIDNMA